MARSPPERVLQGQEPPVRLQPELASRPRVPGLLELRQMDRSQPERVSQEQQVPLQWAQVPRQMDRLPLESQVQEPPVLLQPEQAFRRLVLALLGQHQTGPQRPERRVVLLAQEQRLQRDQRQRVRPVWQALRHRQRDQRPQRRDQSAR